MEFNLFNSVPDPRVVGRCTYNLSELLTIGLLTFLCGGEDYVDMQEFAETRARTFGLLSKVKTSPSCDTFERIFASVSPDALEECLREYGKKFLQVLSKQQIAIDGKCLRGVNPKLLGNKGLYLMNAFVCENRISISQKVLNDKENEIKAIPKVLESIDIEDAVISIDAIGTQVDIVKLILKKHGHYFLAVKENQKTLYESIRSAFGRFRYQYTAETPEKDHGRIEQRTCRILSADKLMDTSLLLRWEGIKTIIEIESVVTIGDKTSTNFRYYISDIKEDNSSYYNNLARNHWGIENHLHWHLDVNFREDASRARTNYAPQNLSLIRKIALEGIVRHKDKKSIAKRRFRACMSDDYLLNLLKSCNF